ncbi:MAG: exodeoxyribonuclease VII small subunit [Phycisphaeraceae bacterium]|nr:exodeoxyribonuclease VII small subunit [Phycisphaeraceae bacterium]
MSKKKTTSRAKTDEAPDFETAVAQVEAIIDRIEQGEIGLEESVAAYEQGVRLIQRCRGILDTAEQKITELTGNADSGDAPE